LNEVWNGMVGLWLAVEEKIFHREEEDKSRIIQGRVESVSDTLLICQSL